jgi:hypothetical protein
MKIPPSVWKVWFFIVTDGTFATVEHGKRLGILNTFRSTFYLSIVKIHVSYYTITFLFLKKCCLYSKSMFWNPGEHLGFTLDLVL